MKVSIVGLLFLAGVIGQLVPSAWAQPLPADTSTKLHFRLLDLRRQEPPIPAQRDGLVRVDEAQRVQIYIRPVVAVTQALRDRIMALGGKIDGEGLGVIQAWVPIDALMALAALPEVRYIRPPDYGHPNVGSVTTQGDVILGASAVRQQFGVDGTGVRVGVISTGITALGQSIALGDLPPTTFFCRSPSGVITQRTSDCLPGEILIQTTGGITARTDSNLAPGGSINAEGTAMLEIVHDLAPGAELWFANFATTVDYAAAASFLAANVDIVVKDIAFLGFFPNGQNSVALGFAQIMANPANRARAYIQSLGNYADKHYSGLYTDSGLNSGTVCDPFNNCSFGRYHLFTANTQTTGPSPSIGNQFTVPPFPASATVYLSWNDPAGASTNDYDLVIYDCFNPFIIYQAYVPQISWAISSEFASRSARQLSSASASMSFTVSFSQARSSRRSLR